MTNIGRNIRRIRQQKGITQDDLAEQLFVTRQTVSNYETGRSKPDIDTLLRIAEILHVDLNEILYGPTIPANRKKEYIELLITGCALIIFTTSYIVLTKYFNTYWAYLFNIPHIVLALTLVPAMWFMLGWTATHSFGILMGNKPIRLKYTKTIFILLIAVTTIIILMQLPYVIWMIIGLARTITHKENHLIFPNIPIYTQIASMLLYMTIRSSGVYAILGAAIRLFRPRK